MFLAGFSASRLVSSRRAPRRAGRDATNQHSAHDLRQENPLATTPVFAGSSTRYLVDIYI